MTSLLYQRNGTTLVSRTQGSDALGRPATRSQQRQSESTPRHDTYTYNDRSELTGATLNRDQYGYTYDNIGNRHITTEEKGMIILSKGYITNNLNQYTRTITPSFMPRYDADGNQTLILTPSGIWQVEYNAENRPVQFTRSSDNLIITCAYDYMGRRFNKSIVPGNIPPSIEYYVYRGYLQIAALQARISDPSLIHSLVWDPLYPEATRPLALYKDNSLSCYAHDFNKNVTELFTESGTLSESYNYDPYGKLTAATGSNINPIRFSSEYYDEELGLVYYNYRHYNPNDGRWIGRDLLEQPSNPYSFIYNSVIFDEDVLGLESRRQREEKERERREANKTGQQNNKDATTTANISNRTNERIQNNTNKGAAVGEAIDMAAGGGAMFAGKGYGAVNRQCADLCITYLKRNSITKKSCCTCLYNAFIGRIFSSSYVRFKMYYVSITPCHPCNVNSRGDSLQPLEVLFSTKTPQMKVKGHPEGASFDVDSTGKF